MNQVIQGWKDEISFKDCSGEQISVMQIIVKKLIGNVDNIKESPFLMRLIAIILCAIANCSVPVTDANNKKLVLWLNNKAIIAAVRSVDIA